jgi:peptide/nickel transport system permease protein
MIAADPLQATAPTRVRRPGWRTIRPSRGLVGLAIVLVLTVLALLAPSLPLPSPTGSELTARLQPPDFAGGHPFGTDQLGRDLLSRVVFGARISLAVGFTTVFLAGGIGVLLGLVAGYFGGWVDNVIMRLVDVLLAFPFLVLAIALVAVLRPSLLTVIVVLSLWGWLAYARLTRGVTLSLREKEFVEAARVVGAPDRRILLRHILPNILPSVLVLATFQVAQMMVAESALSFLGLGVPPPTPSWGSIIGEGRQYVSTAWWLATLPGLVLTLCVLGVGFIGDWLRDLIDPRLKL